MSEFAVLSYLVSQGRRAEARLLRTTVAARADHRAGGHRLDGKTMAP
jgi:hypothetical protein